MKNRKAPEKDGTAGEILKYQEIRLHKELNTVIMKKGRIPEERRTIQMKELFKKGEKTNLRNYR